MKAIGFKNFRKFIDFPDMPMGDITIFVGGNNSGKSTTVKAIISTLTFLRNARLNISGNSRFACNNKFYFNQDPYVHIGTFNRARCNKTDSNDIFFEIQLENYLFSIYLNGDGCDEKTTYAKVQRLVLKDIETAFEFDMNFDDDSIMMYFRKNTDLFESRAEYVEDCIKINELKSESKIPDRVKERKIQLFFEKYPVVDEDFVFSAKLTEIFNSRRFVGGPLISGILYNASYYIIEQYENSDVVSPNNRKYDFLRTYMFRMSHILDNILWDRPLVEYIYAHAASQIVLYSATDNNYLSKTIHEFAELSKVSDSDAYQFVNKWMNYFEIGRDFKLESIGGEAHTFDIIGIDEKLTPLADKGMGTIQLMILLLRIAIIINGRNRYRYKTPITVVVEEPEQNLHPKVQSELINFFSAIMEEYKVRFIIETHSEYLVRKIQTMVAKMKYETQEDLELLCPYKIYYFQKDDNPYKMNFRTDGKFSNKFGPGFYDEASNLSFDLF